MQRKIVAGALQGIIDMQKVVMCFSVKFGERESGGQRGVGTSQLPLALLIFRQVAVRKSTRVQQRNARAARLLEAGCNSLQGGACVYGRNKLSRCNSQFKLFPAGSNVQAPSHFIGTVLGQNCQSRRIVFDEVVEAILDCDHGLARFGRLRPGGV